jgi:CRP/FNR family transcriptional regulator
MPPPTDLLAASPYFAGLPEATVRELAERARSRSFQREELIYMEGEVGEGLYFLVSGAVKLFMTSPTGKEQVFRIVRPGGSFNEIPTFDEGPNPAGAQAMEAGSALVIPRELLLDLARSNPDFALAVTKVFAERLRTVIALVEDLSFRTVTGRVAHLLLEYSGAASGNSRPIVLSQQEIANLVGTAREVVGRAMRALEVEGAIRMERQYVEVLAPELLERWV